MLKNATHMHIELTDELTTQIDNFAAKTGLSSIQVVTDAVQQYLTNQDRWKRDMDAALLDIENGAGYDGDQVLDWMESWGTDAEKPRPQLTTTKL